jgi:purine nucleosidase
MPRQKIIIDTDPGQDDAVAMLLAFASEELEVLGITAVAGNASLAMTEINARKICELAGRGDARVFAGCAKPLFLDLHTAPEVHGETGLDGPDLPMPSMPLQPKHAVDFIIETVMAHPPGAIILCPLGPLTNVATAMLREPSLAKRLKSIVLMGGAQSEGGNSSPVAEFNIFVDPHAAAIVLKSGAEIVMFPLDVTHQVLTAQRYMQRIKAIPGPVGRVTYQMLDFYRRFDEAKYGTDGGPLHDPCVIAWLLQPDLFQGTFVNVEVETASALTIGQTVVDRWKTTKRAPNVHYMMRADAGGFFDLLLARLVRL